MNPYEILFVEVTQDLIVFSIGFAIGCFIGIKRKFHKVNEVKPGKKTGIFSND